MNFKFYIDKYKSSNSYTQKADQTITSVGLLLPFAMLIYGILIQLKIVYSPNNNVTWTGFIIIMLVWLGVGINQTIKPGDTPVSSTIRLLEFYTMSGVYFLLISGVYNPFVFCWPILLLASYTYFETGGLKLGILAFLFIIIVDIFRFHPNNLEIIISDILLFITLNLTGVAIITVMRTHEIRKEKFFKNVIKESLQRDRVATIVNNLTDAVLSTDKNGVIRVYNAACLSLLDTNENLNGKNIDKVLPLFDRNNNQISVVEQFKHSKAVVVRDDLYYLFSDGEKMLLETTYTPIRHGYNQMKKSEIQDGYIIIFRDITKLKSLEEERDEFISVISHELRTPITITEGTISNVQAMMEHPNATNTMIKDSITVAHDQVMFLASIINDLSALSKAERGVDNDPEYIDINELFNNVVNKFEDDANNKNLKVSIIVDKNISYIYVSRLYIEELLHNLISNAIKYTKKGSVEVSAKKDNDKIIFAIKDTGIGISKSDQIKIFEKFYQSEDYRTRETGGTGLGLYIAQKLAEQMGTKINLESKINHGSIFSFSLDLPTKKSDQAVKE